jgi:hypothetical protein
MSKIRIFSLLAAVLMTAPLAATASSADCGADQRNLQNMVSSLQSRASGMGICQLAREEVRLYRAAAAFHRRCASGAAARAQAAEYDRAANQAQATANASCM